MDPPRKLMVRRPSVSNPPRRKPDMPSATPLERMIAALELGRRGHELMRRVQRARREAAAVAEQTNGPLPAPKR